MAPSERHYITKSKDSLIKCFKVVVLDCANIVMASCNGGCAVPAVHRWRICVVLWYVQSSRQERMRRETVPTSTRTPTVSSFQTWLQYRPTDILCPGISMPDSQAPSHSTSVPTFLTSRCCSCAVYQDDYSSVFKCTSNISVTSYFIFHHPSYSRRYGCSVLYCHTA